MAQAPVFLSVHGMNPRVWLIGGATASGKSSLALQLALRLGGEIVNADSMQVYADLRVLTARPTSEQEAQAPHHLYGLADAAQAWSVGRWRDAAENIIADILARDRTAIIVGGTGLYFRALTTGLADIPPVPAAIRDEVSQAWAAEGETALRGRLAEVDPASAHRIAEGDRQRLTRAFEVFASTGQSLTEWQASTRPTLAPGSWRGLIVEPERQVLYDRCDARLAAMWRSGALDEVERLIARRLDAGRPALKALGVAPIAAFLRGEVSEPDALDQARRATRHYAKRQLTWFRHQAANWPRTNGASIEALGILP